MRKYLIYISAYIIFLFFYFWNVHQDKELNKLKTRIEKTEEYQVFILKEVCYSKKTEVKLLDLLHGLTNKVDSLDNLLKDVE